MSDHDLTPDDQVLAAELALGVLSGRDHAAAQARFEADPEFRAAVEELGARLAPLAEDTDPEEPTRDLLPDILAAIGSAPGTQRAATAPATGEAAAAERPATQSDRAAPARSGEDGPQDPTGTVVPFRRKALVRFGPLVSALAASLLIVAILLWPGSGEKPTMIAELTGETEIGLEWHDQRRVFVLALTATVVPEGQVAELWAIPEGGAPISLGLREPDGGIVHPPDELLALIGDGLTLAVSLEPPGGSPEIGPTGPVIASGVLRPA